MTTQFEFDRLLASVLDLDDLRTVPSSLVEAALTRSREVRQRRPLVRALDRRAWPAGGPSVGLVPSLFSSRLARVLILALVAALVALGVIGSAALRREAAPKVLSSVFVRPFEYAIPVDSAIRPTGGSIPEMVSFFDGPGVATQPPPENIDPGARPAWQDVRGVVVGAGGEAWSHGDDGRFMLRTAPEEFLADLRDIGHVPMSPIVETTVDGRPALSALLLSRGGTDIHVTGRMKGLSGNYVMVNIPSRLIVTDIDGITVFILIWARTPEDLTAWMPVADELVDSIHFLPEGPS